MVCAQFETVYLLLLRAADLQQRFWRHLPGKCGCCHSPEFYINAARTNRARIELFSN